MKTLFITGTDTGVGKTVVTSSIAAYLSLREKMSVGVMKPFESGLPKSGDKDIFPRDAVCLKEASGSSNDLENDINPYTFEAPLAPEIAADMEQIQIDMDMVDRVFNNLKKQHDILVIEGAGGVLVPIIKDYFYVDLMRRWDAPVLIVSRLGLGTINHTLLTSAFLQSRGVKVVGVVLNDSEGVDNIAARTNPDVLRRYLNVPILGVFPYAEGLLGERMDRERLASMAEYSLDMGPILSIAQQHQ